MTIKAMKIFKIGKVSEPVVFAIDEDEFEAIPVNRLPAGSLAKYFQLINESQLFEAHEFFFKAVLTEESSKLFMDRLYATENPITIGVMGDVASWLLGEVYMGGESTSEDSK